MAGTGPAMTTDGAAPSGPNQRYGVMETGEKSTNQLFG
jgi:hypothetical protein